MTTQIDDSNSTVLFALLRKTVNGWWSGSSGKAAA
jgi:hypothetical protein